MIVLYADVGGTNIRVWNKGRGKVEKLIIGIRGVWTSAEKSNWKHRLQKLAPSVTVLSDIELAYHLAFGNRPGIVLNAGTGSIAYGRNSRGKTARAGGLGPLLGDEGSGFWIGREYLKALYVKDGNLNRIRRYGTHSNAVKEIAGLAKIVLRKARGNPKSIERKIVNEARRHLKRLVVEVKRKLDENLPVKVIGGVGSSLHF